MKNPSKIAVGNAGWTLITGASSGIGKAFAELYARRGHRLVLVARSGDKLTALAQELGNQYKTEVLVCPADLSNGAGVAAVTDFTTNNRLEIDVLVNNAGVGLWTPFLEPDLDTYMNMMWLNMQALVALTHAYLPAMTRRQKGTIINITSTGAFQPCPYIAVYCASKAFVQSFSEALYGELQGTGVQVLALAPGNTETGFQSTASANVKGLAVDTPEMVAEWGLRALEKKRMTTVVGTQNYLTTLLPRILPRKAVVNVVKNMMGPRVLQQR